MVRLRRGDSSVIVAIGLSRTGAEHLADHIAEVVQPDPVDTPTRSAPAQRRQEVTPLA